MGFLFCIMFTCICSTCTYSTCTCSTCTYSTWHSLHVHALQCHVHALHAHALHDILYMYMLYMYMLYIYMLYMTFSTCTCSTYTCSTCTCSTCTFSTCTYIRILYMYMLYVYIMILYMYMLYMTFSTCTCSTCTFSTCTYVYSTCSLESMGCILCWNTSDTDSRLWSAFYETSYTVENIITSISALLGEVGVICPICSIDISVGPNGTMSCAIQPHLPLECGHVLHSKCLYAQQQHMSSSERRYACPNAVKRRVFGSSRTMMEPFSLLHIRRLPYLVLCRYALVVRSYWLGESILSLVDAAKLIDTAIETAKKLTGVNINHFASPSPPLLVRYVHICANHISVHYSDLGSTGTLPIINKVNIELMPTRKICPN